jgi:hypothetical protein
VGSGFDPDDFDLPSEPPPANGHKPPSRPRRVNRPGSATELLGTAELALELGVSLNSVQQRRSRGRLPTEDLNVSTLPMWYRGTLRAAGILPA